MMAAPRFATAGMKSSSIQAGSSATGAPSKRSCDASGTWLVEWLPQIVIRDKRPTPTPRWAASCASARLWSSRVIAVNRSGGTSGA